MSSIFELETEQVQKLATKDRSLNLAIIHITFEGIQILGGGVCTVTRGHLEALKSLQRHLKNFNVKLTPYFAEIGYADDHPRRDKKYEAYATESVKNMGGEIAYLANYSWGEQPHTAWGEEDLGPVDKWKAACASAATVALNFARRHQAAVIYCHDCVFALTTLYASLQANAFGADIRAIYVVHSTALTHELPLPNPDRLMAECATIQWGKINPAVKIGYISEFIRGHLVEDYAARLSDTVPTGNGLNPADRYFRLRTREEIVQKLEQYQIPLNKKLIFSWGRAVAYKRFDMVIKAGAKLKDEMHTVVVVSPASEELTKLRDELNPDMSLIFAFDAELAACLIQWENTLVTPILAYLEPCGLTPMEIRMHARKSGPILIVSDTGGLPEQVKDGVDGFITKQDDVDDVVQTIRKIQAFSEQERQQIRNNGLKKILDQYTWTSQILKTLASVSPHIALVKDDVMQEIVQDDRKALALKE